MRKLTQMIKYLFVLPCFVLCLSNVYGQAVCYPQTTAEANAMPGTTHNNPASCNISEGDPTAVITIPEFDCAAVTAVTFETPTLPDNPRVWYHYWGNCSPDSPAMPTGISAKSNGYIQQMFCATDGNGLPAWPGGLSGDAGLIDFLPQTTEDVGCLSFAEGGTCVCGGGGNGVDDTVDPPIPADDEESGAELIQIDFWLAIPQFQSQVGFRFSGARDDAGSFFVGPNLNSMCEVAFYTDGQNHATQPEQLTGTFNIADGQLVSDCGLSWMRVRLYINDIRSKFIVNPEINAGNGWVNVDQLLIEPAVTASDINVPPVRATTTVSGYSINGILYDNNGNWDPYACNPVVSDTNTGICPDCDPAIVDAVAPPVIIASESTCPLGATVPSGGVLSIPTGTCPAGTTLEYSIDSGTTWSDILPTYDQANAITVRTRCVCNLDMTVITMTNEVTTTPSPCCESDCGVFPANGN